MRRKPNARDIELEMAFQAAWDEFGDDKSTEFLISITADREGTSYERVVDALAALHDKSDDPS